MPLGCGLDLQNTDKTCSVARIRGLNAVSKVRKNEPPVIRSEAKDLGGFRSFDASPATAEILRGVYPERITGILRFAQNDKRRTQDDTFPYFFMPSSSVAP